MTTFAIGDHVRRKPRRDGWVPATLRGEVISTHQVEVTGQVQVRFAVEPHRRHPGAWAGCINLWTPVARLDRDDEQSVSQG